jgi:hypothetical protein
MNNTFLNNLRSFGSVSDPGYYAREDFLKNYSPQSANPEEKDLYDALKYSKSGNNDPFQIVQKLYSTWKKEAPDSIKGTVFEGVNDSGEGIFDEYLRYKAEDAGTSLDRMTEAERVKFASDVLSPLGTRAHTKEYWEGLDEKRAKEASKVYSTYQAVMSGVDDYIKNHRAAKKAAEEDESNYVTFVYKPGDTFGQKLIDEGLMTEHGLWGDDGDVAYYTQQLRDGDYLDAYGNVRIGEPIRLKRRK